MSRMQTARSNHGISLENVIFYINYLRRSPLSYIYEVALSGWY